MQHSVDRAKLHQMWAELPQMKTLPGDTMHNIAWMEKHRQNPFQEHTYSFEDASKVMTAVSQHYPKVRDAQCQQLKEALVAMDGAHTGRVLLKHFYAKQHIGPW